MKKKIILCISTLLCFIVALTSCFGGASLNSFVDKDSFKAAPAAATSINKISVTGNYSSSEGDLAVFTKTENLLTSYNVFNVKTGATVWSASDQANIDSDGSSATTYSVELVNQWDTSWFYVTETVVKTTASDIKTTVTYTIYTAQGTRVASSSEDDVAAPAYSKDIDLISFANKVYRIDESGNIAAAIELGEFRKMPALDIKAGEYYIHENNNVFLVYDEELNIVSTYAAPSYADDVSYFVLSNGNILLQYGLEADPLSEDYTILEDGVKYDLVTLLIKASNGKAKELDFDYVILECLGRGGAVDELAESGVSDKIDNIAILYPIENNRVVASMNEMIMASVSNNGKIESTIGDLIEGMMPGIVPVANNRWEVANLAGQSFILNEKGKIVGESTNVDDYNANYFVINNKVYNWDFLEVCDLTPDEPTNYALMNTGILYETKDGAVKFFANGTSKVICPADGDKEIYDLNDAEDLIFVVEDDSTEHTAYHLYNYAGTVIKTFTDIDNITVRKNLEGTMIIEVTADGITEYYLVK